MMIMSFVFLDDDDGFCVSSSLFPPLAALYNWITNQDFGGRGCYGGWFEDDDDAVAKMMMMMMLV